VVLGLQEESGPKMWVVRSFEVQSRPLNLSGGYRTAYTIAEIGGAEI